MLIVVSLTNEKEMISHGGQLLDCPFLSLQRDIQDSLAFTTSGLYLGGRWVAYAT